MEAGVLYPARTRRERKEERMGSKQIERAHRLGSSALGCLVIGAVVAAVAVGCDGTPSNATAEDVPSPVPFHDR
jgi:hypothetical protein